MHMREVRESESNTQVEHAAPASSFVAGRTTINYRVRSIGTPHMATPNLHDGAKSAKAPGRSKQFNAMKPSITYLQDIASDDFRIRPFNWHSKNTPLEIQC